MKTNDGVPWWGIALAVAGFVVILLVFGVGWFRV